MLIQIKNDLTQYRMGILRKLIRKFLKNEKRNNNDKNTRIYQNLNHNFKIQAILKQTPLLLT